MRELTGGEVLAPAEQEVARLAAKFNAELARHGERARLRTVAGKARRAGRREAPKRHNAARDRGGQRMHTT